MQIPKFSYLLTMSFILRLIRGFKYKMQIFILGNINCRLPQATLEVMILLNKFIGQRINLNRNFTAILKVK